jgi:hypothetical protein
LDGDGMSVVTNWLTAADSAAFAPGQNVRVLCNYWAGPGFAPAADELGRAFADTVDLDNVHFESAVNWESPIPGTVSIWAYGTAYETDNGAISASELRTEIMNAFAVLNANRSVGVSNLQVLDVQYLPVGTATPDKTPDQIFKGLPTGTIALVAIAIIALVAFGTLRTFTR